MKSERVLWIDALKGFAMICVILGHMQIPKVISQFCFAFHMPLFFFVSGYLYGSRHPSAAWILRKMDGLLVPYVIYSSILCCIMPFTLGGQFSNYLSCVYRFSGLGFTWFFVCLFFAELIGAWILLITRRRGKAVLISILLCVIVGWILEHTKIPNLFMVRSLFQATAFWMIGVWVYDGRLLERLFVAPKIQLVFVVLLMVAMSVLFPFNRVDMSSSKMGNIILFYGTGCSIVILLALAFNKFQVSNPILVYVGRNSLLFLAMSQLIPPLFRLAMVFVGFDLENGIVKFMQRILTLGCVIGGVELSNRYLPVLSGRLKIFSRVIEGKL